MSGFPVDRYRFCFMRQVLQTLLDAIRCEDLDSLVTTNGGLVLRFL